MRGQNKKIISKGQSSSQNIDGQGGKEAKVVRGRKRKRQPKLGKNDKQLLKSVGDDFKQVGRVDSNAVHPVRPGIYKQVGDKIHGDSLREVDQFHTAKQSSDNGTAASNVGKIVSSNISVDEQLRLLRDPVRFISTLCLPNLDKWQVEYIQASTKPGRTALVAANGVGKTLLNAALIFYFLSCVKSCRVVAISAVYRQLEMMAAHMGVLKRKFIDWELVDGHLRAPNGNEAIWFATKQPGDVESQHDVVDPNGLKSNRGALVLMRDEAKSIKRTVMDASERFQPDWVFDTSSAGPGVGWFFELFTKDRALYKTFKVDAFKSSYCKPTWIDFMSKKYGVDHYMYRESVLAEFTENMEDSLIQLEWINRNWTNPPRIIKGTKVTGIDLSCSKDGDESVIFSRDGNLIYPCIAWRDDDPSRIATKCIDEIVSFGTPKDNIFADIGGPGVGIVSIMKTAGWPVIGVQFGGSAISDDVRFGNRMTELWQNMADDIYFGRIVLPRDDDLVSQLINRKKTRTPSGKIKLESKAEMRDRELPSPDRADALALCLCNPISHVPMNDVYRPVNGFVDRKHEGYVTADGFDLGG